MNVTINTRRVCIYGALSYRRWQMMTELAIATGYTLAEVNAELLEMEKAGLIERRIDHVINWWRKLPC